MPPASADHLLSSFFLIWSTAPSTLQPRHLRAIQSILHWHPAAQVTVLSNTLPTDFFLLWSSAEREARVKVERYDLEELCADSPLADWYSRRDEWNRSTFFSNPQWDLLRLMFLFRRGGVYVDADVVFVRPLRLPSGCEHGIVGLESGTGGVAAEDGWSPSITSDSSAGLPPIVCNAVMAFRAGHPLLAAMLSAFAHEYVPYTPGCTMLELFAKGEWGAMGPLLLSRLLLKRQPPSPPLRATSSAEEGTDDEEEEEVGVLVAPNRIRASGDVCPGTYSTVPAGARRDEHLLWRVGSGEVGHDPLASVHSALWEWPHARRGADMRQPHASAAGGACRVPREQSPCAATATMVQKRGARVHTCASALTKSSRAKLNTLTRWAPKLSLPRAPCRYWSYNCSEPNSTFQMFASRPKI